MATSKQLKKANHVQLQEWVACDQCNSWVVPDGLSADEYLNNKLKFNCRTCSQVEQLTSKLSALTAEVSFLRNKLFDTEVLHSEKVMNIQTALEAKVEKSWTDIVSSKMIVNAEISEPRSLSTLQIKQADEEIQEMRKRKLNLIVSGLPESKEDALHITSYANNNCDLLAPFAKEEITSTERLGVLGGRPRLLRIQLASVAAKRKLLNMRRSQETFSSTKSHDHSQVHISSINKQESGFVGSNILYFRPDLTRLQQEADKKLRAELLIKGKDKFKISRGIIVPRESGLSTDGLTPNFAAPDGGISAELINKIVLPAKSTNNRESILTVSAFGKEADMAAAKALKAKTKEKKAKTKSDAVKEQSSPKLNKVVDPCSDSLSTNNHHTSSSPGKKNLTPTSLKEPANDQDIKITSVIEYSSAPKDQIDQSESCTSESLTTQSIPSIVSSESSSTKTPPMNTLPTSPRMANALNTPSTNMEMGIKSFSNKTPNIDKNNAQKDKIGKSVSSTSEFLVTLQVHPTRCTICKYFYEHPNYEP